MKPSQRFPFSRPLAALSLAAAIAVVVGCGGSSSYTETSTAAAGETAGVTVDDVVKTNADIAFAAYSDALSSAQALKAAVDTFVAEPSQDNFDAAKAAWLTTREAYGQTEVYRFRMGPIDSTDGETEDGPEGRINAWPLGEALIDYVAPNVDGSAAPEATAPEVAPNIIADTANVPTIDRDALLALNESGGDERNVATGYHAIEFLLWGQDLNQGTSTWNGTDARDATPGQRPVTDYALNASCTSGQGNPEPTTICARRGAYLVAATDLLIEDLQGLVDAWNPEGTDNHYAAFSAGGDESLAKMLESMGRLGFGELAGERMNIALTQDSQEDEHSCFSDNTHRDIVTNALGIQNTYLGRYVALDGTEVTGASLDEYLRAQGAQAEADALTTLLEDTMTKVGAIDEKAKAGTPFDQQIQQGGINDPTIKAAINALVAQTDAVGAAATALGLEIGDLYQDTEEPLKP